MMKSDEHCPRSSTRSKDNVDSDTPDNNLEEQTNPTETSQSCGYGPCHPRWFQVFLRPKVFIAAICCFAFMEGYLVIGVNNANTASYEKRFLLSSSRAGAVSSSYNFTAAIFAIPVSYFAAHAHKPRVMGVMAIIFAIGSFIMLLPHFTTDVYYYGQEETNMCKDGVSSAEDGLNTDVSRLPNYLYVLCLGMALMGIGNTAIYSVGASAVDESVSRQSSAFAIGIFYGMTTLGTAVGFLLGASFLKIYVDADVVSPPDFDETDARWIGAWWIGFVIPAAMFAIVSLMMFAFPRTIPVSQKVIQSRIDQSQSGLSEEVARPGFGNNIRDIPLATWNLLRNLPFVFLILSYACDGILWSGLATFLAKFIEQQFNKSVAFSNLVVGAVVVIGAVSGQLVGGYVCKKANLKVRGMLVWCAACAICTAALASSFWLRCDDAAIAGVNRPYQNGMVSLSKTNTTADCNAACKCTDAIHEPVCGADTLEYVNPCYAGCYIKNNDKTYSNCSCIDMSFGNGLTITRSGRCDKSCVEFYIAIVLYFFFLFTLFLTWAPRITLTLRCVPETQRTYALGLSNLTMRLLGAFPGPIAFGSVVDLACKYHRETSDDNVYSCLVYDRYELSRNIFLLAFLVKLTTLTMFLLALFFYKPPKLAESSNQVATEEVVVQGHEDCQAENSNEAELQNTSLGTVATSFVDGTEVQPGSETVLSTKL